MQWERIAIPTSSAASGPLGKLQVAHGRKLFVGRTIVQHGLAGWQAPTTAALLTAWEIGAPVFYDVGANFGIYAMLHARLHPEGTTVAFEPTSEVADWGEAMTSANELDVRWERLAVSDHEGEAKLYVSARSDASNSLVEGHRRAAATATVPVETLDSYIRRTNEPPAVIKIDVERHEPAVIRGAMDTIREHRPVIVAELLPGRHESDEVRELLADHYEARLIEPPADAPRTTEPLRDWLFWPGAVPAEFEDRFAAWFATVTRCTPTAGTVSSANRPRRSWMRRHAPAPVKRLWRMARQQHRERR